MPSQIYTPMPVAPRGKGLQLQLITDIAQPITMPQFAIRDYEYTVPAPPPPSPVSFHNSLHWLPAVSSRH